MKQQTTIPDQRELELVKRLRKVLEKMDRIVAIYSIELEASVTVENNVLSADVSREQLCLKIVFGDFSKVRIWKKFAFAPSNIMEDYRGEQRNCLNSLHMHSA